MATSRKFQLEVLHDRKVVEQVYTFVADPQTGVKSRQMQTVERVVPECYMVYFPAGHSIVVETKEQLTRLGLLPHQNIEIDVDTGLPVLPPAAPDIKASVERRTVNTGGRFSAG